MSPDPTDAPLPKGQRFVHGDSIRAVNDVDTCSGVILKLEAAVLRLQGELAEARRELDRILGCDPCPKCGSGVAATCYGCERDEARKERDAALASVAALTEELDLALSNLVQEDDGGHDVCAACGNYSSCHAINCDVPGIERALSDTQSAAATFVARIQREAREECARVADERANAWDGKDAERHETAAVIAARIRAQPSGAPGEKGET